MDFKKSDCIKLTRSIINELPHIKNICTVGDKCVVSQKGDIVVIMKLNNREYDLLPS